MSIIAFVAFCQASVQNKDSVESERYEPDMIDYCIVRSGGGETS